MKTLSKLTFFGALLAVSSVSLAGDCNCQNGAVQSRSMATTVASTPQRYSYRSGYSSVAQPAAPVTTSTYSPQVYSPSRPIHGPEANWAFMRARQHVRGW